MSDEEIKLMREIGDTITTMVMDFYRSKRAINSLQIPNEEIREVLARFSSEFYMRAKLNEYEKVILNTTRKVTVA